MFLTLAYLPKNLHFSANICFKNVKFPWGNYQPIVLRHKHSHRLISVQSLEDVCIMATRKEEDLEILLDNSIPQKKRKLRSCAS